MRTSMLIAAIVMIVIVVAVQFRGHCPSGHRGPHMDQGDDEGRALVDITIPDLSEMA